MRLLPLLLLASLPLCAQPLLTVQGEVGTPLNLSLNDLRGWEQTTVTNPDKEGKSHTYRGVTLYSLLQRAGVTLGKELHGEHLAKYVLITASDDYKVVLALPEVDPEFTSRTILVALETDGQPCPLRLIIPGEKRASRSIRGMHTIKVAFALK